MAQKLGGIAGMGFENLLRKVLSVSVVEDCMFGLDNTYIARLGSSNAGHSNWSARSRHLRVMIQKKRPDI